jgi:O-antigen ligase
VSRAPRQGSATAALAALHDTALLVAVFYAPIFWGQVSIPETTALGQISASAGQTLAAGLVFLALISALLARWAAGKPPARLPNAIHLPAALLLAIAALSTLTSVNPHASKIELSRLLVGCTLFFLVANRATLPAARPSVVAAAFACSIVLTAFVPIPEAAGLALRTFTIVAVGIAVAVMVTMREEADPVAWLRNSIILSAALVVALYGWREKFAVARELKDPTWQIFSTFFNPNSLGGFLAMIFPLAVSATLADSTLWRRLLWGFSAIALASAIIPTKSKGAMVACAAALLLYLVLLAWQSPRLRRLAAAVVIIAVVAMVAAAFLVWQAAPTRDWFVHTLRLNSQSNMFRMLTWKGTLRLFEAHPGLGVGPGAFKYAYPRYAILGYTEAAHQNYLQMFAELGTVGGIVFLWLLASILLTGGRAIAAARDLPRRCWAIGGICSVVALMVHSLLDYDWYIGAINLSFWLVAGMLAYGAHAQPVVATAIADSAQKGTTKRGRQRPSATSKGAQPAPVADSPGRAFRWPRLASGQRAPNLAAWTALLAVASVVAIAAVAAPARNAVAQRAMDTGDAYATSGSKQAGAMALAQYDQARQLDAGWAEAWERYGLLLGLGRLDEGVEAVRHAQALSPTSFRPWSTLGQLYEEEGKLADAIPCFERALVLFPNHTRTIRRLAEAYQKAGEQEKALAVYQRLVAEENAPYNRYRALSEIDVDTNFAFAHYELGFASQRAHDRRVKDAIPVALKHFDTALRIILEYDARAKRTDAMFAALGRPREYRGEEMLSLEAKTRYRESQIYRRVGMWTDEKRERERALELWPGVEQLIANEDKQR